jgi:DNA-binding MarR family transcriptional regulator
MRGSVSDADYRALADFRYQIRRYLNFSEQASRGAGLEPQQYLLLLTVRGLPDGAEATIRTLASRLLIRHHSAVELVDRLEKRGMVRRAQSKTDRRQVLVRLTPRGESALERLARQRLVELRSKGMALVRALDALIGTTRRRES